MPRSGRSDRKRTMLRSHRPGKWRRSRSQSLPGPWGWENQQQKEPQTLYAATTCDSGIKCKKHRHRSDDSSKEHRLSEMRRRVGWEGITTKEKKPRAPPTGACSSGRPTGLGMPIIAPGSNHTRDALWKGWELVQDLGHVAGSRHINANA